MSIELIAIKDIIVDPDRLQFRAEVNLEVVKDFSEAMLDGAEFPPVVIFDTPEGKFLADGFQRFEAYKIVGKRKINCEIIEGSLRDAIIYALGANAKHGARLTTADKVKKVNFMLRDEEFSKLADTQIAKMIGATQPFVSKYRNLYLEELAAQGKSIDKTRIATRKDGTQYEIKTENIKGAKAKPKKPTLELVPKKVTFPDSEEVEDDLLENFLDEDAPDLEVYKNIQLNSKYLVGQHILFYSTDVIKLKKELTQEYELFIYLNHIEYFIKHQQFLLDLSDNVCLFLTRGEDIPKLDDIGLKQNSGTLLSIDGCPYYLAYYAEDDKRKMNDLSVSSTELYAKELISHLTKRGEHILLVNPIFSLLSVYEATGRFCTIVYNEPDIMSRDLMEFAVRFPGQVIEKVR